MRNLAQYPVTADEVIRVLTAASADIASSRVVGDTRPLILTLVSKFIDENKYSLSKFLDQAMPGPDPTSANAEAAAKIIYDMLLYDGKGEKPAWVPGGNSDKQVEARRIVAMLRGIKPGFRYDPMVCAVYAEIDPANTDSDARFFAMKDRVGEEVFDRVTNDAFVKINNLLAAKVDLSMETPLPEKQSAVSVAREQFLKRVSKIVANCLAIDVEMTEKTTMDDLDADSLDAVEIVMGVEEEFGIEIQDEVAENISTIGDIVDLLMLYFPPMGEDAFTPGTSDAHPQMDPTSNNQPPPSWLGLLSKDA